MDNLTPDRLLAIIAIAAGVLTVLSPRGIGPYLIALWLIVYGLDGLGLIRQYLP